MPMSFELHRKNFMVIRQVSAAAAARCGKFAKL